MKKFLVSVVATAAISTACAFTAFADTSPVTSSILPASAEIEINADVEKEDAERVAGDNENYFIIEWATTDGSFSVGGDKYAWNAQTMAYELKNAVSAISAGSNPEVNITISDCRNAAGQNLDGSDYEVAFTAVSGVTAIMTEASGTLTPGKYAIDQSDPTKTFTIDAGAKATINRIIDVSAIVNFSGSRNDMCIGTVTVTLNAGDR